MYYLENNWQTGMVNGLVYIIKGVWYDEQWQSKNKLLREYEISKSECEFLHCVDVAVH